MKIKIYFFVFIFFSIKSVAQWIQTNGPEGGEKAPLFHVYNKVFYSGTNSGLYASLDSCKTWSKINIPSFCQEVTYVFNNDSALFVCFSNKELYYTTNYNKNWFKVRIEIPNGLTLSGLYYNNRILLSYSTNYQRFISMDYSKHWKNFEIIDKNNFIPDPSKKSIFFITEQQFYVSRDNGNSWYIPLIKVKHTSTDDKHDCIPGHEFQFLDENDSIVLLSDGGTLCLWEKNSTELKYIDKNINDVFYNEYGTISDNKIVIANEKGLFYYNLNNGERTPVNSIPDKNVFTKGLDNSYFSISLFKSNKSNFFISTNNGFYISANLGKSWNITKIRESSIGFKDFKIQIFDNFLFINSENGIFFSSDNGLNWQKLSYFGINSHIGSLISWGNKIIAGSENNHLFLTENKGNSWVDLYKETLPPFAGYYLKNIFSSKSNIYAYSGGLFISSDSCMTWNQLSDGKYENCCYIKDGKIYLGKSSSSKNFKYDVVSLFTSDDNGKTWNLLYNEIPLRKMTTIFIYNQNIFVGSTEGVCLITNNSKMVKVFDKGVYSFISLDSLILAGTEAGVYISADCGLTWKLSNQGIPKQAHIFYQCGKNQYCPMCPVYSFLTYKNKIIASTHEGLYITKDRCKSWISFNEGIECIKKEKSFYSESNGILINDDNYMYFGTPGYGVWKRLLSDTEK